MYIGRIVSVARTNDGRLGAIYRVSSRSFPNRTAVIGENKVSIVPKPGFETDIHRNPYIAYNCVRIVRNGAIAVVTNGSQTDPIAEKIAQGMSPRDALVLASLALDYEKDHLNTPRVSAVADLEGGCGWLGIVRHDGLQVERIDLAAGRLAYVATYEENSIRADRGDGFPATTAEEAADYLLTGGVFAQRENPVTAVAVLAGPDGAFEIFAKDAAL